MEWSEITPTTEVEISDLQEEVLHESADAPQESSGADYFLPVPGLQTQVLPEPLALLDVTVVAKIFPSQFYFRIQ